MGYGQYSSSGYASGELRPLADKPRGRQRTRFGDHHNTAHVWAQQTVPYGRSNDGRIWFDGPTIYSYGEHFPMATFTDRMIESRQIVLVTRSTYSVSTRQHMGCVREALRGLLGLAVAYVPDLARLRANPALDWDTVLATEELDAIRAYKVALGIKNRIPADLAAWRVRRMAESQASADAAKLRAALRYIGPVGRQVTLDTILSEEYQAPEPLRPPYYYEDHVRGLDRRLRETRNARAIVGRAHRYPRKVAKASVAIKLLVGVRDAWQAQLTDALLRSATERETRALDAVVSNGRVVGGVIVAANLWAVAIKHGRTDAADLLHDYVQVEEYRQETAPAWRDQLDKTVTPDDWRAGQGPAHHASYDTLVRRVGDTLQTSRGAEVSFRLAVAAFDKAQRCRATGKGWSRNGDTLPLGAYQVDSISPDGHLRAGCHVIAFAEMQRLAIREVPDRVKAAYPLPVVVV